jgi:LysR family transcriptional regulator, repressor for citA
LFERVGNKITLTSAGHHFLPFAREMITKYEQGLDDFESWKQGYKRKLMIANRILLSSFGVTELYE